MSNTKLLFYIRIEINLDNLILNSARIKILQIYVTYCRLYLHLLYFDYFLSTCLIRRFELMFECTIPALKRHRISEKCSLRVHGLIMYIYLIKQPRRNLEKYLTISTYSLTMITCNAILYVGLILGAMSVRFMAL